MSLTIFDIKGLGTGGNVKYGAEYERYISLGGFSTFEFWLKTYVTEATGNKREKRGLSCIDGAMHGHYSPERIDVPVVCSSCFGKMWKSRQDDERQLTIITCAGCGHEFNDAADFPGIQEYKLDMAKIERGCAKRKRGYYWVRAKDVWCIEWFDGDYWQGDHNNGFSLGDGYWDEINENRISAPDENPIYVNIGGQRVAFLTEESLKEFMRLSKLTAITAEPELPKTYRL